LSVCAWRFAANLSLIDASPLPGAVFMSGIMGGDRHADDARADERGRGDCGITATRGE